MQVKHNGKPVSGGIHVVVWMLLAVASLVVHGILGVAVPTMQPLSATEWTAESALLSTIGLLFVGSVGVLTSFVVRYRRIQSSFDTVSWFLTVFSVAALVLLLLGALTPQAVIGSRGIVTALTTRVLGLASTVVIAGVMGFFVALLRARPTAGIRAYLITQAILVSVVFLGGMLSVTSEVGIAVAILAAIVSAVMSLLNAPRLPWLQTLPLNKKLRLLWLAGCATFASILMIVVYVQPDTVFSVSTATLVGGLNVTFGMMMIIALVVFLRLISSVLIALPNSTIVDRRSLEIESLASLARLMAESASTEDVLARTTELAVRVTQAHGAWAEMGSGSDTNIVATQHVHPDYIRSLHQNASLQNVIGQATESVVIDSLADYGVDARMIAIRSLVIVPIFIDGQRSATLVAFMTADYGFHPDDHRLLSAFGDIISIAIEQSRLYASVRERQRLQNEADVAREIQTSLLPHIHPTVRGFDLYGVMIPASEVGGDYFDYVRFADGSLGIVIADVAGKGIPAALYMATLKGAVLAEAREATSPADLLYRLSLTLSGQMERRSYITMSCVQIRPFDATVVYARAGHSPMILRRTSGVAILRPKGVAIGLLSPDEFRAHLEECSLELESDDVCLLTTDGVTERRNAAMKEVGYSAISETLVNADMKTSHDVVAAIQQRLREHAQGAEAHDDVTIVAIRAVHESDHTRNS